ncbi:hypothetical protein [Burkholderia sp. ABCPW 14]|uniref:hypothetical protein n=1 Tax=Burkholderia sp. ABCPW 14 TaxID=1637860 RepID=UPI001E4C2EF4|nr:hypothetical protein [Burkholderia sp. ABCPW 14]
MLRNTYRRNQDATVRLEHETPRRVSPTALALGWQTSGDGHAARVRARIEHTGGDTLRVRSVTPRLPRVSYQESALEARRRSKIEGERNPVRNRIAPGQSAATPAPRHSRRLCMTNVMRAEFGAYITSAFWGPGEITFYTLLQ